MKLIKTRTFKWWEVSVLKIGLISLGILLGIYFEGYLVNLMWLWWMLFAVVLVYFLVRFVNEK